MTPFAIVPAVRARPRMAAALLAGCLITLVLPDGASWLTRGLLGWTIGVWLYLLLVGAMMLRADHADLKRTAAAQAEGARTVLAVAVLSALMSLLGIVLQLSAAKHPGAPHTLTHLMFALATVAGAWLLLPTLFALTYASAWYGPATPRGLRFPDADLAFQPHYADFMYFAVTISAGSQTSDVAVVSTAMRRLVLAHSLTSFAFNTAVLAFTVNVAAGLF